MVENISSMDEDQSVRMDRFMNVFISCVFLDLRKNLKVMWHFRGKLKLFDRWPICENIGFINVFYILMILLEKNYFYFSFLRYFDSFYSLWSKIIFYLEFFNNLKYLEISCNIWNSMHISCKDLELEVFKENNISTNLKEKYMKFINTNNFSNILKYDSI